MLVGLLCDISIRTTNQTFYLLYYSGFMGDAYRDCDHPRMELRIRQWTQDSHVYLRLQCEMCDTQLCESRTSQAGGEPLVTILDEEWCEGPKGFKSPELALKAGVPKLWWPWEGVGSVLWQRGAWLNIDTWCGGGAKGGEKFHLLLYCWLCLKGESSLGKLFSLEQARRLRHIFIMHLLLNRLNHRQTNCDDGYIYRYMDTLHRRCRPVWMPDRRLQLLQVSLIGSTDGTDGVGHYPGQCLNQNLPHHTIYSGVLLSKWN